MKRRLSYLITALMILCCHSLYAKEQTLELSLKSIHVEKTQEQVDELYIDMLSYSKTSKPRHLRIPAKPHHWLSAKLDTVKNVPLLSVSLKPKQTKTVLVSLMEKDAPHWNVNDLLGSFILTLKHDEHLSYATNRVGETKKRFMVISEPMAPQVMAGGGAKYILYFSLKRQP